MTHTEEYAAPFAKEYVPASQPVQDAAPLLSQAGRVAVPQRGAPGEWADGYLALCAIVKDQGAELTEWLEYHRWLGVGRVYVYDNNSTVRTWGRRWWLGRVWRQAGRRWCRPREQRRRKTEWRSMARRRTP